MIEITGFLHIAQNENERTSSPLNQYRRKQRSGRFISDPNEVVSIHQHIRVKVLSIDMDRKRIQLTMKGVEQN